MSDLVQEPSDAEFSRLMDERAPGRLKDNEPPPIETAVETPVELEPEPVVEEPEAETELPDKYQGKSPAELAQMHMQLEQRLGTQGQELGQLRQLAAEVDAIKAAQQQQPETPPLAPWESAPQFDGLTEAVMTNPKETLDWVSQHQPHLYDRAIQDWASIDPFSAGRYDTQKTLAQERQAMEQELQAVRQPVLESQSNALLQQAYLNVVTQNPALEAAAPHFPAFLEENPEFGVVLQNGDLATKERVLNNLTALVSARQAQAAPVETPAAVAAAAKVAATVASGSAGADRPTGGETAMSDWKKSFIANESTSIQEELARNRARAAQAGLRRA